MSVAMVLVFMTIMIIIEVPSLWKKEQKKEAAVFLLLLFIGTGLIIAQLLKLEVPNPVNGIITVYMPVSDAINRMLE